MATATLLITCQDQPGLVAAVSEFLHCHGGNIIDADQHIDTEQGLFLQRVEWSLQGFSLEAHQIPKAFEFTAKCFGMRWSLHTSLQKARLAILASKQPHCLFDLLMRYKAGELNADIPIILSNHLEHQQTVESLGIRYEYLPITPENKTAQERKIVRMLRDEGVTTVVLARYMQILQDEFVAEYENQIINIHHSFLPAFAGAKPYHRAHGRGVKLIGATAHYVTSELDEGPIITQDVTRVTHRDTVSDLISKGRDLEKVVLARALKNHLAHRVLVYGNKTAVFS